ncbi:hypothetical protein [Streptomyces hydrogenans]|uniref:hypothetical protein n=1 Tax=Streptomyces hydrogenans TaxID=1873719 RepID=UPI0037F44CEF
MRESSVIRGHKWPRRICVRCERQVAVMPCGRFARHDNLVEKRTEHWGLVSCAGSLLAAPGPDDSVQLDLLEEIASLAGREPEELFLFTPAAG